jgi:hypothetical protein
LSCGSQSACVGIDRIHDAGGVTFTRQGSISLQYDNPELVRLPCGLRTDDEALGTTASPAMRSQATGGMFMGETAAVPRGDSIIRVRRQRGFFLDSLRQYRVRIDGSPVGAIAPGETMDFIVPPGRHGVRLTLDRILTSRQAVLEIHAGEVAEFTCRPLAPVIPLVGLVLPHRYIRLDGPLGGPALTTRI